MHDKCGVAGISVKADAQILLYKMLIQMQHRGQLSAGITTHHPNDPHILNTHKDLGLVNNVFRAEHRGKFLAIMDKHKSKSGIGHVRYATSGSDDRDYAQPFERMHGKKSKWFSFCFNGNIANYAELKAGLSDSNYHMIRDTDTEIIQHLIAKALKDSENLVDAFTSVASQLDGAYNIGFINAQGVLLALRDPLGLRPFCYSIRDGEVAFASESTALQSIGFNEIKDLPAGHLLIHENGKTQIINYSNKTKKAHCFFEWVYFAHPASKIENTLVYSARNNLGKELSKLENQIIDKDCVVVPVPDSSTPAGEGFSEALGIPLREGLIRNRYLGRTFIESASREDKVKEKYIVIKEIIKEKKVFLVEDSIVRGTTLKNLVAYIRKVGEPKEIHARVACPPIKWPCFYGIDMSSKKELIASGDESYEKTIEKIRKELGVDSLIYLNEAGLVNAINLPEKELCMACLNGKYPTKKGEELKDYCSDGRACTN